MSDNKPIIPDPQYTWLEGLGTALALSQRCMAELRALARTPGPEGKRGAVGEKGEKGERGEVGRIGPPGPSGNDGIDGKNGIDGKVGQPGKFPVVKTWTDGIHYEGSVVTCDGSTWQAMRDTGRAPPHEDWICLARSGRDGADGASLRIRSTWSAEEKYAALDVTVLNGGAFVAKRDNPGPCPGDGWQLLASQGKQGKPGERGPAGLKGERGEPGPSVIAMTVDRAGIVTLLNADGSEVVCEER